MSARRVRGFSLIELMVSVVLGMVLMLVAIEVFIGVRQNHRFMSSLSEMQDNARFAIEYLSRTVRMSAYRGNTPAEWVLGPLTQSGAGVEALTGTDNDADGANAVKDGTDTISITFEGSADGLVKNCAGVSVGSGTQVTNTFSVSTANALQCTTDGGTTQTTLIDGVESIQFMYGLDVDNDDVANKYVTATNITDTDEVVSVRSALLMLSDDDNLAVAPDTRTYSLLGETIYDSGSPAGDMRLRRIVSFTVKLRNRL